MARVAVVTTSYPQCPGDAAGHFVEAHVSELSRSADVHVIAAGEGGLSPHATVHWCGGAELFRWPGVAARCREQPLRGRHVPRVLWRMRQTLDRLAPDRVTCHWLVPCAWPLLVGSTHDFECHLHGGDVRLLLAMPRPLRTRIVDWTQQRAPMTFASHAIRNALCGALDPAAADRVRYGSEVTLPRMDLPHISAIERHEQRRRLGLQDREPVAVFAGRLVASKRPGLALEAAHARGMTLVVIGDGPLEGPLRDRAARLAIRVVFTGQLARRATLATIAAADLVLHPSGVDSAPSVVREARALGVAVLAADAGDVARWAQHDPGIQLAGHWHPLRA